MNVYLKGEESICINQSDLHVKDLGEVYCSDQKIAHQVKEICLWEFAEGINGKEVFSVVDILDRIKQLDQNLELVSLGANDFIVYYKCKQEIPDWKQKAKISFVCLVAFFGAAISIMAYNNDVGIDTLFEKVYEWLTGNPAKGPGLLEASYSIGLAVGIIVFFNHAANKSLSDDPTPFEVQMRLYEKDVNETLITGAGRKEDVL
jgi:stage V sporulation protein AA